MDISQFALAGKDLLRPFTGYSHGLGERTEQFDDLRNVVIIFAVLRPRLRIEQVIARDQFKDLGS